MKYFILAVLVTIIVSSTAGSNRSPITDAHDIYASCMKGHFFSENIKVPTRTNIKEYIDSANEQCITWMVVWYKPLTGYVMKITEWNDRDLDKLNALMAKTISDMNIEMRFYLGVK